MKDLVWLLVLFDLPAVSVAEKRAHTRFRHRLLALGFCRLQWSVYARAYRREKASGSDRVAVERAVPRAGRVRLLIVTELQFERMVCIDGDRRHEPEKRIEQVIIIE